MTGAMYSMFLISVKCISSKLFAKIPENSHIKIACRHCVVRPLRNKKLKSEIDRARNFIDWRKIKVFGGKGGNGNISFLRLWCNPKAGPDGGDGGNGGHIILEANSSVKSLENISSVYRGNPGENGMNKDMNGANGEHTIVQVPVWTQVKDEKGNIVCDLTKHNEKFIAARGGSGGKGNHFFLSNKNRHPRVAEIGADGDALTYILELQIMAHVGLVGFPNAGKSTLLRAISRACPKVAAYPFTTLNPHVGIIHYDDYVQIAVADLPGLILGAHKNVGLGFSFLRHVERCVCLIYVIDLSLDQPWKQLDVLKYELEQYQRGLSEKPTAVVANKIDLPGAQSNVEEFNKCINLPCFTISARKGINIRELLDYIRKVYDEYSKDVFEW